MATRLQESKCRHLQVFKGLNPELLAKYHFGQNLLVEASHKYKRKVNRFYLLKERYTNRDRRNCWQPNLKIHFCKPQRNFPHDSILCPIFFPSQSEATQPHNKTHCPCSFCIQAFFPWLLCFTQYSKLIPFELRSQRLPGCCVYGNILWKQIFRPFPPSNGYGTPSCFDRLFNFAWN